MLSKYLAISILYYFVLILERATSIIYYTLSIFRDIAQAPDPWPNCIHNSCTCRVDVRHTSIHECLFLPPSFLLLLTYKIYLFFRKLYLLQLRITIIMQFDLDTMDKYCISLVLVCLRSVFDVRCLR